MWGESLTPGGHVGAECCFCGASYEFPDANGVTLLVVTTADWTQKGQIWCHGDCLVDRMTETQGGELRTLL